MDSATNEFRKPGSIIKPRVLCETLRIIAEKNATEFYNGTIGQLLVDDLKELGGIITMKDLNEYKYTIGRLYLPERYKWDCSFVFFSILPFLFFIQSFVERTDSDKPLGWYTTVHQWSTRQRCCSYVYPQRFWRIRLHAGQCGRF